MSARREREYDRDADDTAMDDMFMRMENDEQPSDAPHASYEQTARHLKKRIDDAMLQHRNSMSAKRAATPENYEEPGAADAYAEQMNRLCAQLAQVCNYTELLRLRASLARSGIQACLNRDVDSEIASFVANVITAEVRGFREPPFAMLSEYMVDSMHDGTPASPCIVQSLLMQTWRNTLARRAIRFDMRTTRQRAMEEVGVTQLNEYGTAALEGTQLYNHAIQLVHGLLTRYVHPNTSFDVSQIRIIRRALRDSENVLIQFGYDEITLAVDARRDSDAADALRMIPPFGDAVQFPVIPGELTLSVSRDSSERGFTLRLYFDQLDQLHIFELIRRGRRSIDFVRNLPQMAMNDANVEEMHYILAESAPPTTWFLYIALLLRLSIGRVDVRMWRDAIPELTTTQLSVLSV